MELNQGASPATVDLTAVIVAMVDGDPCILTVRSGTSGPDTLPCGPLQPDHRTLQAGLRSWVEYQTGLKLGYMEQLYTFADRDRFNGETTSGEGVRPVSVAYLALVHDADLQTSPETDWQPWYDYLPWEDWRTERPPVVDTLLDGLGSWVDAAPTVQKRRRRAERLRLTFANGAAPWDEERSLERYELLYGARLISEAWHDQGLTPPVDVYGRPDRPMATDHRRILATAVGRLRGKIKYRPLLFELMPPQFTLLQLQRTAEALSGTRLHKQNFRRLVERQQLVEETGEHETQTGGRPARLMRFRPAVTLERPAPGVGVKATGRIARSQG
ncbi:NUDIX hydrolase [Spiribacter vilamensis]|uniref:NrtR DNA-binding winged helix domain-containing protein n=1 Tax=Spiribacter vilamensis TaxID=531306 RepID=A0A4Q8D0I2_9GAMM|nr:hypothetical protein [Spiribacter vilamensis]RZU98772.1 hypothetical protein EV698_1033 [Spiribacter vilamensis]TVO62208.1 hypothetical protein FPL09_09050 [Spiribacter vilamensis]